MTVLENTGQVKIKATKDARFVFIRSGGSRSCSVQRPRFRASAQYSRLLIAQGKLVDQAQTLADMVLDLGRRLERDLVARIGGRLASYRIQIHLIYWRLHPMVRSDVKNIGEVIRTPAILRILHRKENRWTH